MADRDETQKSTSEQPAPAVKAETALPSVESPSISPARDDEPAAPELTASRDEPVANSEAPVSESDSPIAPAANVVPLRLALRRRRMALLAASVTVAAVLGAVVGAVVGAVTVHSLGSSTNDRTAGLQERKAMQQTIARLGDELSTLKTSLDAASKSAHAQTAQLAKLSQTMNEKLAIAAKANSALAQASAEVTGSISAPQTVAAQPTAVAAPTPLPQPRPQQLAAVVSEPRPLVVPGWSVRGAGRGVVLVESRGEIYEVVPGASLPGLGRVESIRRVDGRWIVETPKGLIVSAAHGARYFD